MPADARDTEYVEFAGGVGRIIRQTVVKTFKTREYMQLMQRSGGVNTGLLPFNCVMMNEGRYERGAVAGVAGMHYRLHVLAIPPKITTMRFQGVDVGENRDMPETRQIRHYALALPWIFIFVLYQNNGLARVVMACNAEDDGLAQRGTGMPLFVVPLPNIQGGGNFCLGELKLDSSQPFHAKTNRIVRFIFESVWNNDLWPRWGDSLRPERSPNVCGFKHWADETTKNGQGFWRSLRPWPMDLNLEGMVRSMTT